MTDLKRLWRFMHKDVQWLDARVQDDVWLFAWCRLRLGASMAWSNDAVPYNCGWHACAGTQEESYVHTFVECPLAVTLRAKCESLVASMGGGTPVCLTTREWLFGMDPTQRAAGRWSPTKLLVVQWLLCIAKHVLWTATRDRRDGKVDLTESLWRQIVGLHAVPMKRLLQQRATQQWGRFATQVNGEWQLHYGGDASGPAVDDREENRE